MNKVDENNNRTLRWGEPERTARHGVSLLGCPLQRWSATAAGPAITPAVRAVWNDGHRDAITDLAGLFDGLYNPGCPGAPLLVAGPSLPPVLRPRGQVGGTHLGAQRPLSAHPRSTYHVPRLHPTHTGLFARSRPDPKSQRSACRRHRQAGCSRRGSFRIGSPAREGAARYRPFSVFGPGDQPFGNPPWDTSIQTSR